MLLIGLLRQRGIEPILDLDDASVLEKAGVSQNFVTIEADSSKAVDAAIACEPTKVPT